MIEELQCCFVAVRLWF